MKRGIDHLVLSVADLEAARRRYQSFGFTMTPRAEHPFGAANSLAQMGGNFLELLCADAPEAFGVVIEFSAAEFSAAPAGARG